MNKSYTANLALILGLGLFASPANAIDRSVDCEKGQSIQSALESALPSAAPLHIYISGTCEENPTVARDRVVLHGEDGATIRGWIRVFGARITIMDLAITGPGPGVTAFGGRVRLIRLQIYGNQFDGVQAQDNAVVSISDSTLSSNGVSGVFVQAATLRIGGDSHIVGNRLDGILAEIGSRVMVGHTEIARNVGVGVHVALHSVVDLRDLAQVSGNTSGIGALADQDSAIRIATGDVIFSDAIRCDDMESSFVDLFSVATGRIACTDFN